MVRGNGERDLAIEPLESFDANDAEQIAWSRERLGPERLTFLRDLPLELRFDGGLTIVHANPISDNEHVWPDAEDAVLERFFDGCDAELVAFGHLHLPYVRVWRGKILVDVASVGIPKDGDPRASYALLTRRAGGWEVKLRRVAFDRDAYVRALESCGIPHPEQLVKVFERGRYPRLDDGPIP